MRNLLRSSLSINATRVRASVRAPVSSASLALNESARNVPFRRDKTERESERARSRARIFPLWRLSGGLELEPAK